MPKIRRQHEANGRSPVPGRSKLDDVLRRRARGDEVRVGSERYVVGADDDTASWADVRRVVQGIRWQVTGYLPYGMLVGMIGQPKDGKSALALGGVVRPVVSGCNWFTGQKGPEPGYAIWCDTERRAAINLERAIKWGLPLDRIKVPFTADDVLQGIRLDSAEHIDRLFNVVCRYEARLVVVDSFRGSHAGDENNSAIVNSLQNLGRVAEETNATVLLIHHTKKIGPDEELTANSGRGSNAFLAMISCQWAVDRPDPDSEWRRLRVLGENLGAAPQPLGFQISDAGVEFGPAPEKPRRHTEKDGAEEWLRKRLRPGTPYTASEVLAEARENGHSERTVRKAATERLGIKPEPVRKDGKISEWSWKLVDAQGERRPLGR